VAEILRASPVFAQVEENLLGKIAGYFETKSYSAGATIFRAGAPATALGILARGKANLCAVNAVTGEQKIIEELQVGDPFGDVGVLLEAAHQDAVVAQTACAVLEVSKELFAQLCTKVPGVSHAISKRLAMRLVKLNLIGMRAPTAIASPVEAPAARSTGDIIPFVFISDFNPSEQLLNMVPITVMREYQCLLLFLRDRTLKIGLVNPRRPLACSVPSRSRASVPMRSASTWRTPSAKPKKRCESSAMKWCGSPTGSSPRRLRRRFRTSTSRPTAPA
jgi:CRP-like cAMP-binding protein